MDTVTLTTTYTIIHPALPNPATDMPVESRQMTESQITQLIRDHFCAPEAGDPTNPVYDYMRAVANAIFDPARWKNPIAIDVRGLFPAEREWIKAVICWYHGEFAKDIDEWVLSDGYACD